MRGERHSRHQHELDFGGGQDRAALRGFANSPDTWLQIRPHVDDVAQFQGTLRTVYPRQHQLLPVGKDCREKFRRIEFAAERRISRDDAGCAIRRQSAELLRDGVGITTATRGIGGVAAFKDRLAQRRLGLLDCFGRKSSAARHALPADYCASSLRKLLTSARSASASLPTAALSFNWFTIVLYTACARSRFAAASCC